MALTGSSIEAGGRPFRPVESPAIRQLRSLIDYVFDKIDPRLNELRGGATPATITRAFPSIKVREIDWALEQGLISPINGGQRNQQRFDEPAIAILLCVDNLRLMDSRIRKASKRIAQEEHAKRVQLRADAERKRHAEAGLFTPGKMVLKTVPAF